jgi:branched-chain amino acid aminotransferase
MAAHMAVLVNVDGVISDTGSVSVLDRGFLYGDSVYEVVRTWQGKVFSLSEHLARLRQSAAYLYMPVPWSDAEIQAEIERTLAQAPDTEFYVRIVISRGTESVINLLPSPELKPSLVIVISPISADPQLPETGLHLKMVQRRRNARIALDPIAKTGNYLNNILALLEARQAGGDDALMLNLDGEVAEATTSNIWVVKGGRVYTPLVEAGILHGITRHFLLKILHEQNIPHAEVTLKPEDLWDAEEAFVSSSVRLLMPIRQIEDYTLPQCPGPITRKLWDELLALMTAHIESTQALPTF